MSNKSQFNDFIFFFYILLLCNLFCVLYSRAIILSRNASLSGPFCFHHVISFIYSAIHRLGIYANANFSCLGIRIYVKYTLTSFSRLPSLLFTFPLYFVSDKGQGCLQSLEIIMLCVSQWQIRLQKDINYILHVPDISYKRKRIPSSLHK